MKAIDIRFLLMEFFLALWDCGKNIFIVIVGGSFLLYSFYSKDGANQEGYFLKAELKLRGPRNRNRRKERKK